MNEDKKTNPNGANGTTSDPREQIMWDIYIEKMANGKVNAYESAIEAGYEESSAKNITLRGWFKDRLDNLARIEMLSLAEKKLKKTLEYDPEKVNKDGGKEIKTDLLRIQTDVAKHLTETLGKDKGYSKRNEVTGKDGKDFIPIGEININYKPKDESSKL